MTQNVNSPRRALVTGGGSGIGLATADLLVASGYTVTLMGRTLEKLEAGRAQLLANHPDAPEALLVAGDVTNEDDVSGAVATAAGDDGLDALVASAGDGTLGPIIGTDFDEWKRVINVSLHGVFLSFKHGGKAIIDNGGGAMVAVSSIASNITHRYMGPYNSAKAGVDMLVQTTADELGPKGVRVNAVNPGIIQTDLVAMIEQDGSIGQSYIENMPLGRFGETSDVAPAIAFLCSDASSFITGVCLNIDGGNHLRRGPNYTEFAAAMYPGMTFGD